MTPLGLWGPLRTEWEKAFQIQQLKSGQEKAPEERLFPLCNMHSEGSIGIDAALPNPLVLPQNPCIAGRGSSALPPRLLTAGLRPLQLTALRGT